VPVEWENCLGQYHAVLSPTRNSGALPGIYNKTLREAFTGYAASGKQNLDAHLSVVSAGFGDILLMEEDETGRLE